MLSDELDIYDDLDQFEEVENKKSKELEALEVKYNAAQLEIVNLQAENKTLSKKIKTMEVNLQNLLDTAKAEIKRKDTLIAQLRREKDDICFRRRKPHQFGPSTVQPQSSAEIQQQLEQPKQQSLRFKRNETDLKSEVSNSNNNCWNEKGNALDKQQEIVPVPQREMSAERKHRDRHDNLNSEPTTKPQRSAAPRSTRNSNNVKEREKQQNRERDKNYERSRDRDCDRDRVRDKSRRRNRSRSRSRTRCRSREQDKSNAQRFNSKIKSQKRSRRSRSRSRSRSNHRTVVKSRTRNSSRESERKQDEKSSTHEKEHKRKTKDDFFGNTTEQSNSTKRPSEKKSCADSGTMFQAPTTNDEECLTPKELHPPQSQDEAAEKQIPQRNIHEYSESNVRKTEQDVATNQLKVCKYQCVDVVVLDEQKFLTKQPLPISKIDITTELANCVQNAAVPQTANNVNISENINIESKINSAIQLVNCVEKVATNVNNIKFNESIYLESNKNSSENQENNKMADQQMPGLLTSNTIRIPGLDLIDSELQETGLDAKQEEIIGQKNNEVVEDETPLNEVEELMPVLAVTPEKPVWDDEKEVDENLGATAVAEQKKLSDKTDEGLKVADENAEVKLPVNCATLTASNEVVDDSESANSGKLATPTKRTEIWAHYGSPKSCSILTDDMPTPKRPERLMETLQIIEDIRLPIKIDIENIAIKVDGNEKNRNMIETKIKVGSDEEVSKKAAPVIEGIFSKTKQSKPAGALNSISINPNLTAATVMYAQPDSTKIEDNDEGVAPEVAINEGPDTQGKTQASLPMDQNHPNLSLESDTIEMALKQLHQQSQNGYQPDDTAVTSTSTKGGRKPKQDLMQVLMQSPLQQNLALTQTPTKARSSSRKKIGTRKFNERITESSYDVSNEESLHTRERTPLKKRKLDLCDDSTAEADDPNEPPTLNVTIDETLTMEHGQSVNGCELSTVTKRCSLGHSDYQFERINDEVVLRVTRRKRPVSQAFLDEECT